MEELFQQMNNHFIDATPVWIRQVGRNVIWIGPDLICSNVALWISSKPKEGNISRLDLISVAGDLPSVRRTAIAKAFFHIIQRQIGINNLQIHISLSPHLPHLQNLSQFMRNREQRNFFSQTDWLRRKQPRLQEEPTIASHRANRCFPAWGESATNKPKACRKSTPSATRQSGNAATANRTGAATIQNPNLKHMEWR